MKTISLLIADDHQLIRETWRFILNTHPNFDVVGECGSGEEAIEMASKLRPDIVLMDINLPGMDGFEATAEICRRLPEVKVLAVSLHIQPAYAKKMIQCGAMGYITKNSSRDEMFTAINEVVGGKKYICKEIKNILAEQVMGDDTNDVLGKLSQREMEIISVLRKGLSSKEIAAQLGIAAKTVEVHRHNILKKLNLRNTAALVTYMHTKMPFSRPGVTIV